MADVGLMERPFVWGEADCCLSVCDVLRARGYGDAAAQFRGRYSDEAGAYALAGSTVEAIAERVCWDMGWPEIGPADARDNDLGVLRGCLALRDGGWWLVKTRGGLLASRRVPARVWRPIRSGNRRSATQGSR